MAEVNILDYIKRLWELSGEKLDSEIRKLEKAGDNSGLCFIYLLSRYKAIKDPENASALLASREWIENELADFPGELALLSQYLNADDDTFVELMLRFIASFEDEEFYDIFLAYGKEELKETYTEDELKEFKGKTFNQQKILNIYRRKKYGAKKLFAKTKCVKCGREKTIFLSNLVKDPDKYGSCVCSNDNVDAKIDSATAFYNGTKRLSSNTSGYTGVSYVKTYDGKPYDKWRAYIEVDGKRTYLGDFTFKKDAIEARKLAGEKGIAWYKSNRASLLKEKRKKTAGKLARKEIDFTSK